MEQLKDAMEYLVGVGLKQAGVISTGTGGDPVMMLPQGCQVHTLAPYLPPTRIKGTVVLDEPASFAAYVNRFKDNDSLIFASVTDTGAQFTAVLDYHRDNTASNQPRRCEHRAVYTLQTTKEWERWFESNKKRMDQPTFAEWLEENQDLIVNPPGAELLELITTLEGKNEVRFSSAMRLQSGKNALVYDEDVQLRGQAGLQAQTGQVEVPAMLVAGIAPFQGFTKYEINERLKYRIEGRKVNFWYETISPHRIVRDAVAGVLEQIQKSCGIVPLRGKA